MGLDHGYYDPIDTRGKYGGTVAKCDRTMANMTLLMPGVNMAVQLTKCEGTMANMTQLVPGI